MWGVEVEVGFTLDCQGSHKVTWAAVTSECLCAFIEKCKKRVTKRCRRGLRAR